MIDMADSWRETLSESSTKLWDGSPESVAQIGNLIMDGTMYHDNISVPARELELSFRKTMAAIAIPQSWYLSPDQIFPVIIRVCNYVEAQKCATDMRTLFRKKLAATRAPGLTG
jgi:hypothetical protein